MKVALTNGLHTRTIKLGFSWTVFFFSFIAFAVRKQFALALACLLLSMAFGPIVSIVLAFFANERLLIQLLNEGYAPVTNIDRQFIMESAGFDPLGPTPKHWF